MTPPKTHTMTSDSPQNTYSDQWLSPKHIQWPVTLPKTHTMTSDSPQNTYNDQWLSPKHIQWLVTLPQNTYSDQWVSITHMQQSVSLLKTHHWPQRLSTTTHMQWLEALKQGHCLWCVFYTSEGMSEVVVRATLTNTATYLPLRWPCSSYCHHHCQMNSHRSEIKRKVLCVYCSLQKSQPAVM